MGKVLLRHRSPAYPAISLPKALGQARKFYAAQKHHPAPASAAVSIWGFGAKSSGGLQAISALKQYGLMSESGEAESRHLQLTDLALRIIRDEREPSPERDEAIRQAALTPKIYAEMWEKWGVDLPAEPTIRYFLEQDKKYNGDYINALIADYKDTIAFAKFGEIDKLPSEDGQGGVETDKGDPTTSVRQSSPPPPSSGVKLMEGERIVFTHEVEPAHGVRILASGEIDESVLDALELYVQLQKKRLGISKNVAVRPSPGVRVISFDKDEEAPRKE